MAFLKKLGVSLLHSAEDAATYVGEAFTGFLSKKYPDIDEVFELLSEMKQEYAQEDSTDGAGGEGNDEDDKWRPMLLNLGLLYKLQRIKDSDAGSWYNRADIFVHDDEHEKKLMETFGFYWHLCTKVAMGLRSEADDATAQARVAESAGLDVLFAHATDSLHVDQHCPDFAVVVVHGLKQLVICICGTRMFPAPKMRDVFMDLYADSMPFLHGNAHMGMAIGAKNILAKIKDDVADYLRSHEGYNVMVIGYSLGAGICQLVAMALTEDEEYVSALPPEVEVRCVSFGAPPVYQSNTNPGYKSPHVFSVVYNNDGLASASVATVTKLFMQMRQIDKLRMRRRDILQMLWNPIPTSCDDDAKDKLDDADEDADDDFANKTGSDKNTGCLLAPGAGAWADVERAVAKVDKLQDELDHPAGSLFLFKRRGNDVITRSLKDTRQLTQNLRLRGAMFSHHMPWGYDALLQGFGEDETKVSLAVLPVPTKPVAKEKGKLYPDLSQCAD